MLRLGLSADINDLVKVYSTWTLEESKLPGIKSSYRPLLNVHYD
jgi:hypothetical protein